MKNLEKAILDRLEAKSSHEYMWPRWPAAYEAAEAAKAWFKEKYNESYGDADFVLWFADQEYEADG